MPRLLRALAIRCFATWQLATETVLVLSSLGILLYLLPGVLGSILWGVYGLVYLTFIYTLFGLIYFIIPGIVVFLLGLALLVGSLTLLGRGCVSVAVRYLNWGLGKYHQAKDDLYLEDLFTEGES